MDKGVFVGGEQKAEALGGNIVATAIPKIPIIVHTRAAQDTFGRPVVVEKAEVLNIVILLS